MQDFLFLSNNANHQKDDWKLIQIFTTISGYIYEIYCFNIHFVKAVAGS